MGWQVFTRQVPYDGIDKSKVLPSISSSTRDDAGQLMRPGPLTSEIPDEVRVIMTKSWDNEPEKRLSFAEIDERLATMSIKNVGEALLSNRRDRDAQQKVLNDVCKLELGCYCSGAGKA